MRWSFVGLWVVGIASFVGLLISIGRDFRSVNSMNVQNIELANPHVSSLEVMPIQDNSYNRYNSWFRLEPFATFGIDDDTAYITNLRIRITKSISDSFEVSEVKLCNGSTRRYADTLASLIHFTISQNDSLLMMDRSIAINTTDKFRNQYVEVTIAVPVGHYIKVNRNFQNWNTVRINSFWRNNYDWYNYNDNNGDYDYERGVEYVMKEDGLYTLDGRPSDRNNSDWNDNSQDNNVNPDQSNGGYRYNQNIDSVKKVQEKQIQTMEEKVDSLKAVHEDELKKMKDSLQKEKEDINQKLEKLNKGTALYQNNHEQKIPENYTFIMYI
jgi:hypothetical protein